MREVMLVHRVTSSIHLVSPITSARIEVPSNVYFAKPMPVLLSSPHLVPFVVLDITPASPNDGLHGGEERSESAVLLAEAEVRELTTLIALQVTDVIDQRWRGSLIWELMTRHT